MAIIYDAEYMHLDSDKFSSIVENDELLINSATNGYLDGVREAFHKDVSRKGFYRAIISAAKFGELKTIKFLLNNSESIASDVELADKWASEGYRAIDNRNLRLYLIKQKVTLQTHFTLQKSYEVE